IATRVREDGFVIVRVEGRQDAHSCELIAELVDFLNPDSERVRTMKRALEGLAGDRDFASRVKSLMDAQASTSVLRGARMSCVVSPSQKELRARERARASQERRRSR